MQPVGVAGHVDRRAEVEVPGVDRMEAVDVLERGDRVRDPRLVDVRRAAAAARGCRRPPRSSFSSSTSASTSASDVVGRQAHVARLDAGFRRRLVLRGDVHVRGRVVAHEHGGEADVPELGHLARDALAHLLRQRLPVHAHRRHEQGLYGLGSTRRRTTGAVRGSSGGSGLPICLRQSPVPAPKATIGPSQDRPRWCLRRRHARRGEGTAVVRAGRARVELHRGLPPRRPAAGRVVVPLPRGRDDRLSRARAGQLREQGLRRSEGALALRHAARRLIQALTTLLL